MRFDEGKIQVLQKENRNINELDVSQQKWIVVLPLSYFLRRWFRIRVAFQPQLGASTSDFAVFFKVFCCFNYQPGKCILVHWTKPLSFTKISIEIRAYLQTCTNMFAVKQIQQMCSLLGDFSPIIEASKLVISAAAYLHRPSRMYWCWDSTKESSSSRVQQSVEVSKDGLLDHETGKDLLC